MQYSAHEVLVAPARTRSKLGVLGLGLLLSLVIYVLFILGLFGLLVATSGVAGAENWMTRMASAATPTSTLLVLATFIGMGLGPLVAAKWLHKRSFGSLFGPLRRTRHHFLLGTVICSGVYCLTALVSTAPGSSSNLSPTLWAAFLPLALLGILIQTGAEEVLFRGYVQSQLAARFASPLVWMVLPSAVFAVLHYQPQLMGENAWVVVGAVFLFALCAADLTARTGSIGAAWGFHFANNCVAILFVSTDGPLSGLALYTVPDAALNPETLRPLLYLDMTIVVVTWGLIRTAVSRR